MLLSIETTEKYGSVALLDGCCIVSEIDLPRNRRSSQTLNPAIDMLFKQTGGSVKPADVDTVAVVVGPGSFTGLRVGVTAAKIFAYLVGAKIIGVSTFHALNTCGATLSIGVDAQRGEVIVSTNGSEPVLMSVADWWNIGNTVFTGPALERYASQAPRGIQLAEPECWLPKAAAAGLYVANHPYLHIDDCFTLVPVYSRLSAAEERLKQCSLP